MKLTSLSPDNSFFDVSRPMVVLPCLIAIFVSLYHPALTNDYAYSDDYFDFLGGDSGGGVLVDLVGYLIRDCWKGALYIRVSIM